LRPELSPPHFSPTPITRRWSFFYNPTYYPPLSQVTFVPPENWLPSPFNSFVPFQEFLPKDKSLPFAALKQNILAKFESPHKHVSQIVRFLFRQSVGLFARRRTPQEKSFFLTNLTPFLPI